MKAHKLIILTVTIVLLVPFVAFGCRSTTTAKLEERIEELERQLVEQALKEETEKQKPERSVEETPEEVSIEEEVVEESGEATAEEEIKEKKEEIIYEIAFESNDGGSTLIYSCKPDGSDLKRVHEYSIFEVDPCWNSDHTQIAFSSWEDNNLYIYDLTNDQISIIIDTEGLDYSPNFSPDSKSVVFVGSIIISHDDADWEIFTVNIDGTNLKQLTNKNSSYSWPHYSPDGTIIIFSNNMNGYTKLYTMDTEGNNIVQISDNSDWEDLDGTFSPDGKKVVFQSDRSGNDDIWIMPVGNPAAAINLTNNPATDISPDWSPDGNMIVFASNRDKTGGSSFDIFTMDTNGEHQNNITPDLKYSDEGRPSW